MDFGIASVAAITVIAYLVGLAAKNIPAINDKWIPVICAVVGGALGALGMKTMPDFPATEYITAVAVGIVSGWAATGLHQTIKQLSDEVKTDA